MPGSTTSRWPAWSCREDGALDAITLEVWWSRLVAIADEAATSLLRTAFSTIIRESNDYTVVVMNTSGQTIAECHAGIPGFAALMSVLTRQLLARFPADSWRDGDIVITNGPWIATGHLPDIAMVTPVFHNGALVGFTGTAAHVPDIGGTPDMGVTDLMSEGLLISPLHLQVKEVRIGDAPDRFVICFNPDAAERDAAVRADLIAKLEDMIARSDQLSATKRAELRGKISTMPGLNRFLRVTPGGLLRADKTKAKAEENLDGKYLLRCADPTMTAEDIALGYKQLLEVERGWRDMKSVLDLRPACHRLEERIRAHVILCWLALLLIRVAENQAGQTWPKIRRELDRIHVGTFTGPAGTFRQLTEPAKPARDLLAKLAIAPPRKIHELTAPRT